LSVYENEGGESISTTILCCYSVDNLTFCAYLGNSVVGLVHDLEI